MKGFCNIIIEGASPLVDVSVQGNKVIVSINGEHAALTSSDVGLLIDNLKDAQESLVDTVDYSDYAKYFSASPEAIRQLEKWHQRYVPATGTPQSQGGNLVRNVELILYRYFNDGDMVGIRGRDPSKVLNKASGSALQALYSINDALGIETLYNKEFADGIAALSTPTRDEVLYRKRLGQLVEYTVSVLRKAEPLDVFVKRSIKKAAPRRRGGYW